MSMGVLNSFDSKEKWTYALSVPLLDFETLATYTSALFSFAKAKFRFRSRILIKCQQHTFKIMFLLEDSHQKSTKYTQHKQKTRLPEGLFGHEAVTLVVNFEAQLVVMVPSCFLDDFEEVFWICWDGVGMLWKCLGNEFWIFWILLLGCCGNVCLEAFGMFWGCSYA